jgi:hypothetical protein
MTISNSIPFSCETISATFNISFWFNMFINSG